MSRIITSSIICMLIVSGIVYYLFFVKSSTTPPQERQNTSTAISDAPQQVIVNIPNADPFPALIEDYSADNSLWRIVDKQQPLNNLHYRPEYLTQAPVPVRTDKSADEQSVRTDIVEPTKQLFAAAKDAGFDLIIGSGFRDYELQNMYYTSYSATYGQTAADTFSAKPGYSEHQTGLTMDVSTADRICYIKECFGGTKAGKWLAAHAHEYGFIIRYPRGKEGITDFIYEPWHVRYVGNDLAKAVYKTGLAMEEIQPYLKEAQKQLVEEGLLTPSSP
jgi:D-alanyl-D-alanine carboxypeptidase